ncbi:MAG: bacterial proteasome activator family protein [Jatrophihabitantaceae bacterium]
MGQTSRVTEPPENASDSPPGSVDAPISEIVEAPDPGGNGSDDSDITGMVEQPAKVMRIGTMIKQLLEEVRAAPLDEAGRHRLREIHESSIRELEKGLAPDLREELDRLTLPFGTGVPSEAELRIAQAQLVGWLEGLFHGIQTALFAQQMAARAQLEQMRGRALPGAPGEQAIIGPGGEILMPRSQFGHRPQAETDDGSEGTGQYL